MHIMMVAELTRSAVQTDETSRLDNQNFCRLANRDVSTVFISRVNDSLSFSVEKAAPRSKNAAKPDTEGISHISF